ncbi:hypothetical protein [Salisediminibacterium selenitireducens]|uniref:Uncharacterized protein n=1 Tax=Bacillus selenitireducens (strain ATCC 700615 / DSM 15326 / MLS10) TaxID=439292 RepID=D6XU90_BACIE|nr:hypothetical protein [Salisediminibacterium selenitireducens]ADH99376.1 hypothetical protein Bsel_1871 [[Bacillus] selenitireducens MLS10]
MKTLFKGLLIGLGIGLVVYGTGWYRDYQEQQDIAKERESFGK